MASPPPIRAKANRTPKKPRTNKIKSMRTPLRTKRSASPATRRTTPRITRVAICGIHARNPD